MKSNSKDLWLSFRQALLTSATTIPPEDIAAAWDGPLSSWTDLYFQTLLPSVAAKMGLSYCTEKVFRIDAVFHWVATNGYEVPAVCIESENNLNTSIDEIKKLCWLNAPLKILFVWADEWTEELENNVVNEDWFYLLDAFLQESQLVGYLGVIVAEWQDNLVFNTFCYNEKGERILFDRLIL